MKTLETFYFPDTAILTERQFPLFLLFGKIHILAPVEDHFPSTTKKLDTFMDSRFCQVHTPHPLGEDRQRFLYLINDIQNRKDDYAAQLSNITLASMSDQKGTGDEAKYQIVSSLLGRHSADKKDRNEQQMDLLWQARLVLKIGEMLDQEEEEVARSLVHLDESEADLFERLKGENAEDDDIAELYSDLDRINVEGLTFDAEKEKLLIGLRSPVHDDKALILSLLNPYEIFSDMKDPIFDTSIITLDLQGAGIRSMTYDTMLSRFLIAGETANKKGKLRSRIWSWDGLQKSVPIDVDLPNIGKVKNIEGLSIVRHNGSAYLLFVCDNGKKDENKGGSYGFIDIKSINFLD